MYVDLHKNKGTIYFSLFSIKKKISIVCIVNICVYIYICVCVCVYSCVCICVLLYIF